MIFAMTSSLTNSNHHKNLCKDEFLLPQDSPKSIKFRDEVSHFIFQLKKVYGKGHFKALFLRTSSKK